LTKELAVASWQHTVSHFLFTREALTKNNMTVVPHPPSLPFSVSLIEDKTEMPPFWHNWDGWGRISCCAKHPHNTTSRMHLKHSRSAGSGVYAQKGTLLRVMIASMHKVNVLLDGSTSPRNYGWLYVCNLNHAPEGHCNWLRMMVVMMCLLWFLL
jgi:hypothetical protein